MTRRRWIADEVSDRCAAITGSHAEHLIRVLRARVGQEFDIGVRDAAFKGRISRILDQRVEFQLSELLPSSELRDVTLVLAIIKFDRMEWAIEKCTELGVTRIVPLAAKRSGVHLASASLKRMERWRRIAREAAEQSRRSSPPQIQEPIKPKQAAALPGDTRIFLSESENDMSLGKALQIKPTGELVLATGPEGGWTEAEQELFRGSGWISVSLGRTILRAETAAIAATAIALAELE